MLVGFSAPGLAVAHGYAHHEAHEHPEHDRHEHVGGADRLTGGWRGGLAALVPPTDDHQGHAHPELSRAVSVRLNAPFIAALPPEVGPLAITVLAGTASLRLTASLARAGPPEASPRQPRAPPLG